MHATLIPRRLTGPTARRSTLTVRAGSTSSSPPQENGNQHRPTTAARAASNGDKHKEAGATRSTKAADTPPSSSTTVGGVHPSTTLQFYTNPSAAVAPYLKDVQAAEHARGSRGTHRLAKTHYSDAAEAAVNEQIGREWALAYHYEALASLFSEGDRALPGVSSYFKAEAEGERADARAFMAFQATRGGSTRLPALAAPEEFLKDAGGALLTGGGPAKPGDVTKAFEAALALEAMNFSALEGLHAVAEAENDPQLQDFVEDMLTQSAGEVKAAADFVSQLGRVGPGLGEWLFDRELARGGLVVFED